MQGIPESLPTIKDTLLTQECFQLLNTSEGDISQPRIDFQELKPLRFALIRVAANWKTGSRASRAFESAA